MNGTLDRKDENMKNAMMRLMTWIMILSLALTGMAFAEENGTDSAAQETVSETAPAEEADPVVVVFNGEEIRWSEFQEMAEYLASAGYTQSAQDYAMAYSTVIDQRVVEYKMKQAGLYDFTEEETAAFQLDAEMQWEDALNAYVSEYLSSENPTEDEIAALRLNAIAYFNAYGIDLDYVVENVERTAAYDRLEAYIAENYDVTVSDADIEAVYQSYVEEDRSYFENSVPMYEYYTRYMGYEIFYRPEGFRGVLQILLDVDSELLTAYQEKLTAYESQQAAGTDAEGETVTAEDVEAARAAVIASRQDTLDEIYSRLDAGEAFIDLIPEYNIDPGMQNEAYLASGYEVAADSILYDAPFVEAAFDENMTEVGAVSSPKVGSYGIYVVYYLRDIPAGAAELTEEVAESIREELAASKLNEAYASLIPQWLDECDVTVDAEKLYSLSGLIIENGIIVGQDELVEAAE